MARQDQAKNRNHDLLSLLGGITREIALAILLPLGLVGTILSIVTAFGWNLLASILVLLLCALIAVLFVLYKLAERYLEIKKTATIKETFLADLEAAYSNGEYGEVLKFSMLSRPLRVTGRWKMCVELGHLLEKAARQSNQPIPRAWALIDNLGWVLFKLNKNDAININEARKNILHGINIAREHGDFYLVHRGYRHLSGIELSTGTLDQAEHYYTEACTSALLIKASKTKQGEVAAGLLINEGLLEVKRQHLELAHEKLKSAQDKFNRLGGDDNRDRAANVHHLIGDVLYALGSQDPKIMEEAIDAYIEGLMVSKRESRKDGKFTCLVGLARIEEQKNDMVEAIRFYKRAYEVAEEMELKAEMEEIREKLERLRKMSN